MSWSDALHILFWIAVSVMAGFWIVFGYWRNRSELKRRQEGDPPLRTHTAAIWRDPYAWIPEAGRILRPGGRLAFLGHSVLAMLCSPEGDEVVPIEDRLIRDLFGMHRFDWSDATEFQIQHSEMIRLLRRSGFEVEDLIELRPPEGAATTYDDYAPLEWARAFPAEHIWKLRKG